MNLKIIPCETKKFFFIIPKRHVRLAVLRNTIKRHVRELVKNITAKIVFKISSSVTKKNLDEVLVKIKSNKVF